MLQALPLRGAPDGPTVTSVVLEVQEGEGIVVLATATDPGGSADLQDVIQTVRVFRSEDCEGTSVTVRDDLSGSGVEESFGTAVDASTDATLFERIAAAGSWPVEVEFRDVDANTTSGRVAAAVVH